MFCDGEGVIVNIRGIVFRLLRNKIVSPGYSTYVHKMLGTDRLRKLDLKGIRVIMRDICNIELLIYPHVCTNLEDSLGNAHCKQIWVQIIVLLC